jgi:hypothetical protein
MPILPASGCRAPRCPRRAVSVASVVEHKGPQTRRAHGRQHECAECPPRLFHGLFHGSEVTR